MSQRAIKWSAKAVECKFLSRKEIHELRFAYRTTSGWGDWLRRFAWAHYVTLSFAYAPSEQQAIRLFMNWIQRLERLAGHTVGWFFALERGGSGWLHIHAFTAGTANVPLAIIMRTWRSGDALMLPYDERRGAAYYVAKDIGSNIVHYDIATESVLAPWVRTGGAEGDANSDQ